jgi:hypothetical protein
MMNRRKFFALLPAAPVALVTWPAEAKASPDDAPRDGERSLVLQSTEVSTPLTLKKEDGSNRYMEISMPKEVSRVSMAVGRDGNLWLKGNDGEWKRVVTE